MTTLRLSEARSRNVLHSRIKLVVGWMIIFRFNKDRRHRIKLITSRNIKRINWEWRRGQTLKEEQITLDLLKVMRFLGAASIEWTSTNTSCASTMPTTPKPCHHTCATSNQKSEAWFPETNRWQLPMCMEHLACIKIFSNNRISCTIKSPKAPLNQNPKCPNIIKARLRTNWIMCRSTCLRPGIVNANNQGKRFSSTAWSLTAVINRRNYITKGINRGLIRLRGQRCCK